MKHKLISIIIPVFNRENLIVETLNSIKNQTHKNWECLLIDDHSTDNSVAIIKEFIKNDSRFIYLKRPINKVKGANSCRNYGFKISKGDYINWFDSDDIMHKDFISSKTNSFKENVDVVISKTCVFVNSIDNIVYKEKRTHKTKNILEDFLTLDISWYLPDTMWRRSFLENKELFDESLFKGQDRDFHTRMLVEKPFIIFIDKYLTFYRRHNQSITDSIQPNVILSFFNSLNKRVLILEQIGMSNKVKLTFLKLIISTYAQLFKEKGILKKYYLIIRKLFIFDTKNIKIIFKFILAILFFNTIGKGSKFLKN